MDALTLATEQLRQGFVDCHNNSTDDFHSLGVEVELLRDHLGVAVLEEAEEGEKIAGP